MKPEDVDAIFKMADTVTTIMFVVAISMFILSLLFGIDRVRNPPRPRPKARADAKGDGWMLRSLKWMWPALPPEKQRELERDVRRMEAENKRKQVDRLVDKIMALPPEDRAEMLAAARQKLTPEQLAQVEKDLQDGE